MTLSVHIRNAVQQDASAMSSLMLDLSRKFICPTCEPSGQMLLLKSMQLEQVQTHLLTKTYQVAVAQNDQLVGVVGIEAGQHLYHLFVVEAFQGLGIARRVAFDSATGASSRQFGLVFSECFFER
jgi:hypothetical protein